MEHTKEKKKSSNVQEKEDGFVKSITCSRVMSGNSQKRWMEGDVAAGGTFANIRAAAGLEGLMTKGPKRVAAYCRVSTLKEEQEESFELQIRYYEKMIEESPELTLAGVYGDKGVSAGSIKKRREFQQMLEDCREGKIDVVMTKSISRFARNLADSVACIRELRDLGIPVIFENEGINTMSQSGEMMISILSAIAQQELNEKSQNIRWTLEKNNEQGKPCRGTRYGYRKKKDSNGKNTSEWEICETEAKRVRLAFGMAEQGRRYTEICEALDEIEREEGSSFRWYNERVRDILKHEAYIGDILTNKKMTLDYLSKKQIKNDGIMPQYYLKDHHPAIISREQYATVQEMIKTGRLRNKPYDVMKQKNGMKHPIRGKI